MRDLLVSTYTPALGSGHAMRTYGVASALAAHRGLDLLYALFDAPEPDAAFKAIPGIELYQAVSSRGPRRLLAYASARLAGAPDWIARGVSPELAAQAARLTAVADRGRVIADGPVAAASLAGLARRRPVIYNAHNLESVFRQHLGGRGAAEGDVLRKFERGLLASAAESWMVSEADIAGARELCPTARLRYVPNVVDATRIATVSNPGHERRAIFVATFTYQPNRAGLRFLLDEVFPRVWVELPDAKLTLVGVGLEQPPSEDPRVEALGFVDDLTAVYERARCAVVPLLEGGGTPLKLLEALAYGLPVIATPHAATGLDVRDGDHCVIAEGGEAFAGALVRVLRDGAPELGQRGRKLVMERYSIQALSELLAT